MYFNDPDNEWGNQILVINFIIASTIEKYSMDRGATQINIDNELLLKYFESIIVPEIDDERVKKYPILSSQCIKFIIIYRNYIPHDWMTGIVEKLTSFLTNESIVIRTYSSCAIDKLLSMRNMDTKEFLFTKEVIKPMLLNLLSQLNFLITQSDGLDQYALKSLFRIVSISKDDFVEYAENFAEAIGTFCDKAVGDSTTTPYSIYILFETIGYIISLGSQVYSSDDKLSQVYEKVLLPKMNKIMNEERSDVTIYIMQIYAAFILKSKSSKLDSTYETIAKSILENPDNSNPDMKYMVPGMIRVLCAIMYKYPDFYTEYLDNIFGLFDKVLKELRLEGDAMEFLSTIIEVYPIDSIATQVIDATKAVFHQMFWYKEKSQAHLVPQTFVTSVLIFMSRYILTYKSSELVQLIDSTKQNLIFNFLDKYGYYIGKIGTNNPYRRHVLVGFCRLVTEVPEFNGTDAQVSILQGMIENICPTTKFFKDQEFNEDNTDIPVEFLQEEGNTFERTAFIPLVSISVNRDDKLPQDIPSYSKYVLQCVQSLSAQDSHLMDKLSSKLTMDTKNYFGKLCDHHGISF